MDEIPHTLKDYDVVLAELRSQVLAMAAAATQNLQGAMQGVLGGDLALCNQVIADDEIVDQLEKDIDETGMAIMMRFNPVATDLRTVITSMNMARTMERIGDHAVNIARQSRKILKTGLVPEAKMLEPLFTLAMAQFRDALTSFVDGNEELAQGLKARDDELDRLHKRLAKALSRLIEERHGGAVALIHLLFVARSLERVGDLSVNLGEEVVFIESAEDIRHTRHQ